jgi:hypothetical protein
MDDKGTNIPHNFLGPYNEGSSVNITCIATGGKNPVLRLTIFVSTQLRTATGSYITCEFGS